jgi:lipopolysaccharide/colanic/teichoic acid biosynthesis glycosyltransferase
MSVQYAQSPLTRLSRWCDIAVSLPALLLLAPLFVVAALLIFFDDGPPVFFRQIRLGRHGRPFMILKFRSMRVANRGIAITAKHDSRITKVGAWLRALKIDELPQLINVLQGSMALIGPRPEVPEYVDLDDQLWRQVLQFRPGITDLASLAFRDEEALLARVADADAYYRTVLLPQKLRLNLQYQQSRSLVVDLKLLWMTARYSFFPRGFERSRILKSLGASEQVECSPANAQV